ncbi:amino acid transporter [Spiractinospora alimapuensis]|uniref:amino acid transporter n=1 Tax=Spiractinospora alimapuensis TaxID=2820884 RepID=UPI001F31644C|nr:amino acid transporter [Spiractinospora alimapuensis]QVQ52353.1 amino acid transporter [Spiractinospora alimapuensis]
MSTEGPRFAIPRTMPNPAAARPPSTPFRAWMLADRVHPSGPATAAHRGASSYSWWKVVCLTGVDYFSTLSYLPAIAALAAGAVAPLATLVVVALTLLGVLPMYRRVARESPHGQGSVAMLGRLLPFWQGKFFVLVLLGFVVTAWIMTITLSSADATVHLLENPLAPEVLRGHNVLVTIGLILVLGVVFLIGFREAIIIAVPLVIAFLGLNAVVVVVSALEIAASPQTLAHWGNLVVGTGVGSMLWATVVAFPLLALGLSGFETGVSMMPLVRATGSTPQERLASRIRNTRRMLTAAAVIMSVYLIATSVVTTVLIPPVEFDQGGEANGRALAYLAHLYLGETFGTVYDLCSVAILWFAGASALAGLINIVPRYLPKFGMAPEWTRAARPVVVLYTLLAIAITVGFEANVDDQSGAYATGILAMLLSAAVAVLVSVRRVRHHLRTSLAGLLIAVLAYALLANVVERPDGVAIAGAFVAGIIVVSLVSRVFRTTELRVDRIEFDDAARALVSRAAARGELQLIAHRPDHATPHEYLEKLASQYSDSPVPRDAEVLFVEVEVYDPSVFSDVLHVTGTSENGFHVLRVRGPAAPNTIAALLLTLRDGTGLRPHCHFQWENQNPLGLFLRYLILGQGDTAILVREIVREKEPDPRRRPQIHVGG